jgi:predicted permease
MWKRLQALIRGGELDRGLNAEVRFHIEMETEKNIALGMTPEDARLKALRSFGPMERHKEETRDARGISWLEAFISDLRLCVRGFLKNPAFALVAVATLALGIGANTAIFSVMNAAFFAPYGVRAPQQLVRLWGQDLKRHQTQLGFSAPKIELLREHQVSFSEFGATTYAPMTLLLGEPVQVNAAMSTSSFLDTFGATPIAGRFFREDEERTSGAVVIGEALWRARFGADRSVISRQVTLDGVPLTIIGIAPRLPAFWDADIFSTNPFHPAGVTEDTIRRGYSYLQPIGRLKPGVSIEQANRELELLARRYGEQNPGNADAAWTLTALSLRDDIIGASRSSLFTLLAAVGLLLVVACANVANLLLVRFTGRRQEIGLRVALGASRGRLVRQFLVESLLLSSVAAGFGALVAYLALPALLLLARNNLAFANDITLSVPVLLATFALALLSGIVLGLYPAVKGSRADIVSVLRDGGRTIAGAADSHRARRLIVAAQVAVSLVLLIGAGLLVTSFAKLRGQPPGFDANRVFVAGVAPSPARYPDAPSQGRFYLGLAEELRRVSGVESAALTASPPLSNGFARAPYAVAEGAVPALNERPLGLTTSVTPGYFATLRIPLLAGRDFTDRDTADAPLVAIVSRATDRRLGGDRGLIGRRVIMGSQGGGQVMEVIGVVDDVRTQALTATSEVEFYRPVLQRPRPSMQMVVRTTADAAAFEGSARRLLTSIDSTLPLIGPTTLEQLADQSLARQRLLFVLLGVFALMAVVLSSVGIYGVVASFVGQRTPEIGVRMALGAGRRQVVGAVLRQNLTPIVAGLVTGLFAAIALGRFVEGLLFEMSALDPALLTAGVCVLALVSGCACAIPALRAARIDPVTALRGE